MLFEKKIVKNVYFIPKLSICLFKTDKSGTVWD